MKWSCGSQAAHPLPPKKNFSVCILRFPCMSKARDRVTTLPAWGFLTAPNLSRLLSFDIVQLHLGRKLYVDISHVEHFRFTRTACTRYAPSLGHRQVFSVREQPLQTLHARKLGIPA